MNDLYNEKQSSDAKENETSTYSSPSEDHDNDVT